MEKACAYCDAPPPFTREHIWPSGFLRRDSFGLKYSGRANKTFRGDLVIADVCARCNNGPLSVLDAHACELYDRRFGKRVESGSVVTFTYDYSLLMRWLLKISYNSARTTGQDVEQLSRYRETIISPYPCSPVGAAAYLATVAPVEMLNEETGERKRIYPDAARCGPLLLPGVNLENSVVLRCVMINAFYFTLMITRSPDVDHRQLSSVLSRIPGRPLEFGGRMRVGPPSLPANIALQGIENWPRPSKK